ncbi:WD domain, G-beta repeat, putative [Trypanosoma equiperdum]|uniref:WD domain, G-beta repeat, putative n=1 Tax=Trypanosoma equiperdum TaxID=5694 RepID=A0A1G4IKK3_TRYEQ|nr:WD domain, G-beta repeat, putative [Trypanosoma equiperdum]
MIGTRRSTKSTSFQHLYGSQNRTLRGANGQKGFSHQRNGTAREEQQSTKPPGPRNSVLINRVVDVLPLFSINGTVRYIEAVGGRSAWTAEADGCIRVRSVPKGTEVRTLEGREGCFCTCILYVESTNAMWTTFSDGFIRVFDFNTHALLSEFIKHDKAIECIWEVEGYVFTGGRDWQIYQWKPDTYVCERRLSGHNNTVRCLCQYAGDTGAVLFSGSDDGTVRAWDPYLPARKGKDGGPMMHIFTGHTQGVLSLELVTVSNQLWSGGEDTTIRVYDLQTLGCVSVLKHHRAPVSSIKLIGIRVWSADKYGKTLLWDPKTLTPLKDLTTHMATDPGSMLSICKVKQLVSWKVWTACSGGKIYCWNADSIPIAFDGPTAGKDAVDVSDAVQLLTENKGLRGEIEKLRRQLMGEAEDGGSSANRGSASVSPSRAKSVPSHPRHHESKMGRGTSPSATPPGKRRSPPAFSAEYANDTPIHERANTASREGDDARGCTTCHERFFYGDAWEFIFRQDTEELCAVIRHEVATVLGIPADQVQITQMELGSAGQGCVVKLNIQHSASLPPSEIDTMLSNYPFIDVYELYGRYLAKKYGDPNEVHVSESGSGTLGGQVHRSLCVDDSRGEEEMANGYDDPTPLQNMINTLLKENEELRGQLMPKAETPPDENNAEVRTALTNYEEERMKPRIAQLEKALAERDETLHRKDERIRQLERELEATKSDTGMKEVMKDLRKREKKLLTEVEALTSQVEAMEEDKRRAEDDASFYRRENELLRNRISAMNEQMAKASGSEAEEMQKVLTSYEEENVKPRIARLEEVIAEKDENLQSRDEKIKKLEDELEAAKQEAKFASGESVKSNGKAGSETETSLLTEVQVLRDQVEAMEEDKRRAEDDASFYRRENELLRNRISAMNEQMAKASGSEAEEMQKVLTSYEEENVKPRIARLEEAVSQRDEVLRSQDERIKELTREIEENRREDKKGSYHVTDEAVVASKEEVQALKNQMKAMKKEKEKLENESKLYRKENESLKERLSETDDQLKKSSSLDEEEKQKVLSRYEEENMKARVARLEEAVTQRDEALRAKDERIRQLEKELRAAHREVKAALEESKKSSSRLHSDSTQTSAEELRSLKTKMDEMENDKRRLNEEIVLLRKENETLKRNLGDVMRRLKNPSSFIASEKQKLLSSYEEEHVKPRITRLEHAVTLRDERLQAKEDRIRQLERELDALRYGGKNDVDNNAVEDGKTFRQLEEALLVEIQGVKDQMRAMAKSNQKMQEEAVCLMRENQMLRDRLAEACEQLGKTPSIEARETSRELVKCEDVSPNPRIAQLEQAVTERDEILHTKDERIRQLERELEMFQHENRAICGNRDCRDAGRKLAAENQELRNLVKYIENDKQKLEHEASFFKHENDALIGRIAELESTPRAPSLSPTKTHTLSGDREALMSRLGTAIEQVHNVQKEREAAERKIAVLQEDCRDLRMRLQHASDTPVRNEALFPSSTNCDGTYQTGLHSGEDAHLIESARRAPHSSSDAIVELLPDRLTALEDTMASLNTGLHDAIRRLSSVSDNSALLRTQIADMLSQRSSHNLITDPHERS